MKWNCRGHPLLRDPGQGLFDLSQQRAVVVPGVPQLVLVAADLFEDAGAGAGGQGVPASRLAPLVHGEGQEDGKNHRDGLEEQLRKLLPQPGTEPTLRLCWHHGSTTSLTRKD